MVTVDKRSLTVDKRQLTVDKTSLTADKRQLTVDKAILTVDKRQPTVDKAASHLKTAPVHPTIIHRVKQIHILFFANHQLNG